jgi:putative acetyltransferase
MACGQSNARRQSGRLPATLLNEETLMAIDTTAHEGELDHDDVRDLLALHFREMRAGSPPSACHVLEADSLKSPAIRFMSLRSTEGKLLGVGALKSLEPEHGELKSMRSHPDARGRGVGRALLDALIKEARAMGMARFSLETGNTPQFDAANRLYRREGFVICGPFGGYAATPFTLFYTRNI